MQTQEIDPEVLIKRAVDAGFDRESAIALLKEKGIIKPPPPVPEKTFEEAGTGAQGLRERTTGDDIKNILGKIQPIISGLVGAGGTGLAAASGFGLPAAGLAGSGAMAGSDYILNKFLGNEQSHPISGTDLEDPLFNAVSSVGENTLVNEGMNRGVSALLKRLGNTGINALKESDTTAGMNPSSSYLGSGLNATQSAVAKVRDYLLNRTGTNPLGPLGKGSVSGELSSLDPTFSQYLTSKGKDATVPKVVENLLAGRSKVQALVNSSKAIEKEAEQVASKVTGKAGVTNTTDALAKNIQIKAQINSEHLQDAITDMASQMQSAQTALNASPGDKVLVKTLKELTKQHEELWKAYKGTFGAPSKTRALKDLTITDAFGKGAYDPNPIIDTVLYDYPEMQRFFDSGEIKVGGQTITSNSPRKELAGFGFKRMFDAATDLGRKTFSFDSLKDNWNRYKITEEGKKLFNAQTRGNIDQFIEKASHVSESMNDKGASKYLALRLGTASVALGSGLVSGLLGGSSAGLMTSGAIVGGVFSLHQLGKLMTNPDVARLMIASVSGGPLNMAPQVASRLLARALRGEPIKLEVKGADGKVSYLDGKIDAQGKFASNTKEGPGGNITVKY